MSEKREPLETLRDGSLKTTFWLNDSKNGQFISVTPGKTFEDRDGKLRDSNSYSGSDLLRMSELFRQAHYLNQELRQDLGLSQQRQQAVQKTTYEAPAQEAAAVPAPQQTQKRTRRFAR